jgi:tetratricopeptide (TPR) repeat protein
MGFKTVFIVYWIKALLFFHAGLLVFADELSVGKLRSLADGHFTSGDFQQAIEVWSRVISLEPNNDSNFYKRFRVYLRQQKLREALSDLNSVLTINPKNENALVQRAKLNVRLGNCAEGENDYYTLKS